MAEPCFNARVLAATLLGNSETFSKEMIKYSNDLNTKKILGGEKIARAAENLINEKISIALDVRILRGEAGDPARVKLAKDLSNRGYTLKQAVDFFNKLENISLKDIDDYGGLLFREGENYENVSQAMNALREAVATHIITESHLMQKYGIRKERLTVGEGGAIEWTEKGKEKIDQLGRQIKWREQEIDRISKGLGGKNTVSKNASPAEKRAGVKKRESEIKKKDEKIQELTRFVSEIVPISNRWTDAISELKRGGANVEDIVNNYIIGSVFIGQVSDEQVMKVVDELRLSGKNIYPPLTVKNIEKINDVDELFQRIYMNAFDIVNSREIRAALKEKMYHLLNDGNDQLIMPVMVYADGLMNTLLFCDAGDSFSDTLRYHRVGSIIQDYLAAEKGVITRKHAKTMFNELKDVLNSEEFIKNIGTTDKPKTINFLGIDFTGEDFLRLIYSIAWDDNLKMIYKYGRNIPDEKIFEYVRLKLFGGNINKAEENVNYLIANFVKPYKYQDLTAMGFKVTSSIPITEEDFARTTFVNFDKRVKAENADLGSDYGARAEYNEALANVNTLTVSANGLPNNRIIDLSDGPTPAFPLDTKYIVIPNGKYSADEGFKAQIQQLIDSRKDRIKALRKDIARKNKLGEDVSDLQKSISGYEEDIIIVYPKGKESGQYFIDPGTNKIKYKTTNTAYFNELSRNVAANTFNRATVNLSENTEQITKQMVETTQEKERDLNQKAMAFWKHFLGVEGETLTDAQVIDKLSQMTGIPFSVETMGAREWSLAQDVAFHRYSTSANYYTDIAPASTIDEGIKKARASTPESVVRELEEQGYRPDADAVRNNIEAIREAKVGMETSPTLSDYLWFKGTYIGLATNPQFKSMDLSQFRQVFSSEDPIGEIARLLYGNKKFTKNELLLAENYLGDFTDAIVDEFASNLMGVGYQLPLSSPKVTVINYLRGRPYYGDKFVQDFIYKNGLTDDEGLIMGIFDDYMPSKTTLGSDVTAEEIKRIAEERRTGNIRVKQIDKNERMLPSWHNSYWAAVGGRPVSTKTLNNIERVARTLPRETEADIRKKLSQYFTEEELNSLGVVFTDNMVNRAGNRVWGGFGVDGGRRFFRFSTDAAQGTADHETVHAFINMFFTDEQRNELIDYIIKNHGEEITEFAEKHGYTNLEIDRRAEEWLAEGFVKYVAKMEGKKNVRIKNIPQRVIAFFKELYERIKNFGKLENKITKLYNDIYTRNREGYRLVDRRGGHAWGDLKSDSLLYRSAQGIGTEENTTKLRKALGDYIDEKDKKNGGKGISEGEARQYITSIHNKGGITLGEKDAFDDFLDSVYNKGGRLTSQDLKSFKPHSITFEDLYDFREYGTRNVPGTRRNYENGFTHLWNANLKDNYWKGISIHGWNDRDNPIFHVRGYIDDKDDAYKLLEVQSDFYQGKEGALGKVGGDDFKIVKDSGDREFLRATRKNWQRRALLEELSLALDWYNAGEGPSKFWLATPMTMAYNEGFMEGDVLNKEIHGYEIGEIFKDKLIKAGYKEDEARDIVSSLRYGYRLPEFLENGLPYKLSFGSYYTKNTEGPFTYFHYGDNYGFNVDTIIKIMKEDPLLFERVFGGSDTEKLWKDVYKSIKKEVEEYSRSDRGLYHDLLSEEKGLKTYKEKVAKVFELIDTGEYRESTVPYFYNLKKLDFEKAYRNKFDIRSTRRSEDRDRIILFGDKLAFIDGNYGMAVVENIDDIKTTDELLQELDSKIYDIWKSLPEEGTKYSSMGEYGWVNGLNDSYKTVVNSYIKGTLPAFYKLIDDVGYGRNNINTVKASDDGMEYFEIDLKNIDKSKVSDTTYYRNADPTLEFRGEGGRNFQLKQNTRPTDVTEADVIQQILNNYEKAVEQNIKNKTLTVKKSQDLKQQAAYALNTAIEDLIFPKYGDILTAEQKQVLLGLGYNLKIATNKNDLLLLKEANKQVMEQFNKGRSDLAKKVNMNFSNIEEMDKALMRRGKVYVEKNGNMLVVDVHDELIDSIKSIPDGAGEFTNLRTMTDDQIRTLSNKHAYTLLKLIDIVKMNINRGDFYTQLMMQLNPQLRNVRNGLNFFQAFKAVKIGDNAYIPRILQRNATTGYLGKGTGLPNEMDEAYKSGILQRIYDGFASKGKTMTTEDLDAIITEELKGTGNEGYHSLYANAFAPYTHIIGIPRDTYAYLNKVFSEETASTRKLLQSVLGKEGNVDELWGNVLNMNVTLNDGSTVKVGDLVSGNADAESWKQRLFGDMNKTEEGLMKSEYTDEFGVAPEERLQDCIKGAHAWYNGIKFISDSEGQLVTAVFGNARKLLQRDTNTNQFVEFDYTIGGQNDILMALIEDSVFKGLKITDKDRAVKKRIKQGVNFALKYTGLNTTLKGFDAENWGRIKQMYEIYYSKTLDDLRKMQPPEDKISLTALEMAKYFKTAEAMLGSKDGAKGVAMNSTTIDGHSINRAFGNLGTIIRNIDRADGVYSLMHKIGNNQVIGMFRFAKEGDAAYHPILKRWGSNTTKAKYIVGPGAVGYHEYTRASREDMAKEFNQIFGTNFDVEDASIALQALGGIKFISDAWYSAILNDLLSALTNTAVLTRMVMSYPFQLFTIYPQLFAYNVKADGIKRGLGVENVDEARKIRKEYGILEGTYVEFGIPEWVSKRYGQMSDYAKKIYNDYFLLSDNPEIENLGLEFDDGLLGLYGKVGEYSRKVKNPEQFAQLLDSTRDNANNIIDAAMAQTFKGLAFVKALQYNDFITFMNPKMFKEFMDNPEVSQEIKDKLLRRIDLYANRSFQDMLGIGFTGLDRVYTSGGVSDVMGALLSAINFKGAWGTNMFRQTFEKIGTMWKIAKKNGTNLNDTVKQIMSMPEYTTLIEAMRADMVWSWKMGKFTDTGKWEDESEVGMLDFIGWALDNIELVSQQWQGILSFGPSRLISGGIEGAEAGLYGGGGITDGALGFGVGFLNSFAQNFGRNWKPWALASKALLIGIQNGDPSEGWNYLCNEFYKLSGGTMRYLIEEGETAYGMNTPITVERGRLPSYIMGINNAKSDTSFTYKMNNLKQIEYVKQLFDWDSDNGTRWKASKELFTNFLNNSQALKTVNYLLLIPSTAIDYMAHDGFLTNTKVNYYTYNIRGIEQELKDNSPTFKAFYEEGKIVPPNDDAIDELFDHYMKPNFIGGYKAYQGIQNFIEYGHINGNKDKQGEDNGSFYDRPLEELYARIEEDNPGALERFMKMFNTMFLGDAESDEARKFTFSWFITALKNYKDDPEYKKYVAAYDKGILNYDYYNTLALVALNETEKRKALGFPDGLGKVSSSDISKLKGVIGPINKAYYNRYFDHMYKADMGLIQNEMYGWVADELGEGLAKKYFTKEEEEDWEGAKTGKEKWVLSANIANQIRGDFEFKDLVDKGLYNDALTYSAMVTKRLAPEDDTGLIRAALVEKYVNYIQDSDWSPEIKLSAIAQLMENNDDVFQYNSEFADKYPELYEEAKAYLNDILHNISDKEIKNLNDTALLKDALIDAFKDSSSSSGGGSSAGLKMNTGGSGGGGGLSSSIKSGLSTLSNLAKAMSNLQSRDGKSHTAYTNTDFKILPPAVRGVYPVSNSSSSSSSSSYVSPSTTTKVDLRNSFVSRGYDTDLKTLGPITPPKINKAVKSKSTRKMTQSEENSLDLL